ncbi:MAG: hypothetical protein JST79_19600 [Acidobacteria bacterium]|nr:hypothetical protein [Acidobacteriota bacterium]
MKHPILFGVLLTLSVAVQAQTQFVGQWQTRTSPVTGKPTVTVNIAEKENSLNGTVILVNPDGTQRELPILSPEVGGKELQFHTDDEGATFDWRLTLKKGNRRAFLHGSDRRAAKGGQGGEMVIDEEVVKTP